MSFRASVNLGTVGDSITGQTVSISGCTDQSCTNCTSLVTGQEVNSFPKMITGIPDNTITLFIKVDSGDCIGVTQCISISGIPNPTPTPTSTPNPTPTPTTAPDCNVSVEYATVVNQKLYWNFATIEPNSYPTVVRFSIVKNGTSMVNTTGSTRDYTQYLAQIQDFNGNFSVVPGDNIVFTVTTVSSGSNGNTIGTMGVYSTTGSSGYLPNVLSTPAAPNASTINIQSISPTTAGQVSHTFTIGTGLNYGLTCVYFQ